MFSIATTVSAVVAGPSAFADDDSGDGQIQERLKPFDSDAIVFAC
jgi:hypothetical protein